MPPLLASVVVAVPPIWLLIFSFFFQFLNEPGAGINSSIG